MRAGARLGGSEGGGAGGGSTILGVGVVDGDVGDAATWEVRMARAGEWLY